jgi:hypothetical protein
LFFEYDGGAPGVALKRMKRAGKRYRGALQKQIDEYLEKMSAMESEEDEVGDTAHWEREMRLGGEREGVCEESEETREERYRVRRAERLHGGGTAPLPSGKAAAEHG